MSSNWFWLLLHLISKYYISFYLFIFFLKIASKQSNKQETSPTNWFEEHISAFVIGVLGEIGKSRDGHNIHITL